MLNGDRTLEIGEYIRRHKEIEQYVILDDEVIGDELSEHQVYLDLYKGLQLEHVKPALDILNGKLGFYPKDYDRTETAEERNIRTNRYYNTKSEPEER